MAASAAPVDLDVLGFLAGELSGFFGHMQSSLAQCKATGTLPASLFKGPAAATEGGSGKKAGKKPKKEKRTRPPSAYNHFVQVKLAEMNDPHRSDPTAKKGTMQDVAAAWNLMSSVEKAAFTDKWKATRALAEAAAVQSGSAPAAAELQSPAANGTAAAGEETTKKKKKRKDAAVGTIGVPISEMKSEDGEKKKKKKKKHQHEETV